MNHITTIILPIVFVGMVVIVFMAILLLFMNK